MGKLKAFLTALLFVALVGGGYLAYQYYGVDSGKLTVDDEGVKDDSEGVIDDGEMGDEGEDADKDTEVGTGAEAGEADDETDDDTGETAGKVKRVKRKITDTATAFKSRFAEYTPVEVNVTPSVAAYTVAADLSNVSNKTDLEDFYLSDSQKELLGGNGFMVKPGSWMEFFSIYESNRMKMMPSFITTDSMLHNYHLAFNYLLRVVEKEKLVPALLGLLDEMMAASQAQYEELKGTEWENAAKRNVAFFTVANKLMDPETVVADYVKTEVEEELALIEAHETIADDVVINMGQEPDEDGGVWVETPVGKLALRVLLEDFSQYIPRGHYTREEILKKYFKSMMYLGRLTFRLKSDDETKSALLMTAALNESEERYKAWDMIYEPTVFFVGKSDDINYHDYSNVMYEAYGSDNPDLDLLTDEEKFQAFWKATVELDTPAINSIPVIATGTVEDRNIETKGFRFMGQRYTIDADIFQRLIAREVGPEGVSCEEYLKNGGLGRMLPKGLDITAAMGSAEALEILEEMGETEYACYSENLAKMTDYVAGLEEETWTQNLYWGWMYALRPLVEVKGEGWPSIMQKTAWVRKELSAFLGSWTELKHDTILYAKQVYSELGGGPGEIEEKDDRGYVEPNVYVYARLASLIKMTREGLEARDLLSAEDKEFLGRMEFLAVRLKEISEKELNGEALTEDDYEFIRTYGGNIEHIWVDAFKDRDIARHSLLDEEPAPIVTDVATDPNGSVLQEATGMVAEIFAVVPVEGSLRVARGGVYTYYEFAWPMADRLTDEKWQKMVRSGDAPELPEWTGEYVGE